MAIYVGTQVSPTPGNLQALLAEGERYYKLVEKIGGTTVSGRLPASRRWRHRLASGLAGPR